MIIHNAKFLRLWRRRNSLVDLKITCHLADQSLSCNLPLTSQNADSNNSAKEIVYLNLQVKIKTKFSERRQKNKLHSVFLVYSATGFMLTCNLQATINLYIYIFPPRLFKASVSFNPINGQDICF